VGSGNGNILFGSTVDGGHALTVNAGAGTVSFDGAVGGVTALSGLSVSGSSIDLDNNITTGNADAALNGPVVLRNADEITPVPSRIFFAWAEEEGMLDFCPFLQPWDGTS